MAPSPDGEVALVESAEPSALEQTGFRLTLSNFDGPFDLLVTLIAKHDLDITGGGHTWVNWRHYLNELSPKLFR